MKNLNVARAQAKIWTAIGVLTVCAAVVGVVDVIAPPVAFAQSAQKNKPKPVKGAKTKAADKRADIKREDKLEAKHDYAFDEKVTKTQDVKADTDDTKGPVLTTAELEQAKMQGFADEKLDEEIRLAKQLLQFETKCSETAPVRFRLADLNWEKSKRAFFKSQDFGTSEKERTKYENQMKALQSETVENYKWVVDECGSYEDYAKTLFYLGRALMEMDRPNDGAPYLTRIIKEFADSQWVPNAWLMIGEYYFDTKKDVQKALFAYKRAAEFTSSVVYGYAVYWQGWCYVNTADWDLALERFREVVTISDDPQQVLDTKGKIALRKEGLKDYVRAYSNIGDPKNAYANFLKVGGKGSVQDMMERLGNWYLSQGSHRNVIAVYRELIKNYPRSTRLPIFQGRIVDASSRLGDQKTTVAQAKLLTEYFHQIRDRRDHNDLDENEQKTIVKDLKEAEEIAENTLRRLAMEYHADAKKLRGVAQERNYQFANELYAHYLDVFPQPIPGADVNYVFFMRFYYAEVLYKLEKFHDAAKNYDMVVLMNPTPTDEREKKIVLAAAEESVRSYDQLVQDLDRTNPPEISGTEPKQIPAIKQDLIASCQRYIQYVGSEGDEIVAIRYKMARVYYTYNHFDEAAPAFNDIVTNHPENEVACYAANLALDIYNGQKNYIALKQAARTYRDSPKLACSDIEKQKFARIEEQSTFSLIKTEYEEKKNYVTAAKAYMQFYERFPTSEFADDAVYNAAVNYDLAGRSEEANQTRRFLVDKLPDSELVPETMYNIAQGFERIADFDDAAKYLELFAEKYPSDRRSKDALYNAGIYRTTLGDMVGAKRVSDAFAKAYPTDPEVASIAFQTCEAYENQARAIEAKSGRTKASDKLWLDAHDCYFAYIRNPSFARSSVDHLCAAQYRRGDVMRRVNNKSGAEETDQFVLRGWPGWLRQTSKDKLPLCAEAVAKIRFDKLEPDLKDYKAMRIAMLNPTNDAAIKKFKDSVAEKVRARDKLVKEFTEVVGIGVAEWGLAALYEIGELYRDSVDKLVNAPIPNSLGGQVLTDEQKGMLRQQLRGDAAPIEEKAVDAYRVCVQKANELGVYNKWSVKALDQLQRLRPLEYQPLEERMAKLAFADSPDVHRPGILLPEGDGYKRVAIAVTGGAIPDVNGPSKSASKAERVAATKTDTTKVESALPDGDSTSNTTTPAKNRQGGAKRKGGGGRNR